MQIIPAINCEDFECVKSKIQKAADFLSPQSWVQLDIADGQFTPHKTWNNPGELQELRIKNYELGGFNIEVHLMVENPEIIVENWIKAGVKRIIIHLESIKSTGSINRTKVFGEIGEKCKNANIELGLAVNPGTSVEKLEPYLGSKNQSKEVRLPKIKFVQVLAVPPGKSSQEFDRRVLDKIRFLRKIYPNVIIEVDGGINPETARLCKEAGADILVAGSYIFNAPDPEAAYKRLASV